ncbi:MAG TPA: PsiF family protein [Nitrospiraceae bacterium]|nr:PsiF family protein [Nitrospiraceae bacterium]
MAVTGLAPIAGEAADQQSKMKACNEQSNAKGWGEGKGEERQALVKKCLSTKPVKDGKTAQQEKMKAGNKMAGK